ncbi:MAG: response regulator, partial [Chthoniobacteraceae bacterium]
GTRAAGEHRAFQILLVEDHPDTAAQLSRLLQRAGHRVTWAGSLREARAIAAEAFETNVGQFDLVVSDLGLPDGSGHDLMRELSGKYHLPGIALSGYGMEADLQESMHAGFSQHLTKPVDWQDLKQAIHDVAEELEERDASPV